jgi:hypothetical protein
LIPIPNSTIESTLKDTADKLVRYLNAKPNLVDIEHDSTAEALAKIAKLLNRTDPKPPNIVQPSFSEAIPVTSEGEKLKRAELKSSERNIQSETAVNTDSVVPDKTTTKLNEEVEHIKSIHVSDKLTSTPPISTTPKYNLSPTPTEPFVHPLHRFNIKSIHTPKTIKKFPSIKHSMVLR